MDSNISIKDLLKICSEVAIEAGVEIMKIYSSNFNTIYKSDMSPLTQADLIANELIINKLKNTGIPIISEESKNEDYKIRKKWNKCWLVDPLDGTKEFISKNGEFTVNIALVENSNPVLGVVYIPTSKVLYFSIVQDGTAFKAEGLIVNGRFELRNVNEITPQKSKNELSILCSRSHLNKDTEDFINALNLEKGYKLLRKGSSLKFCYIAEGKGDLYPRLAPTMEWDTAAGHAICKAVGIEVNSYDDNSPLKYNKPNLLNPFFVVR